MSAEQEPVLKILCSNKELLLFKDLVRFQTPKFLWMKGDQLDIPLSQISSIELAPPQFNHSGWFYVCFVGAKPAPKDMWAAALHDSCLVISNKKEMALCEKFRSRLFEVKDQLPKNLSQLPSSTDYSELEKLAELKDKCIIT